MKKIVVFITLIIVIISGTVFHFNNTSKKDVNAPASSQEEHKILGKLIVKPQVPTDAVMVESVTLSKDSYVVLREVVNGKLGQVIEISEPLPKGTHKNVQILVGNADISGKELIVMVYDDQNSDKTFNDFDQPTIDDNGSMIARYIKNGEPLTENIAEGNTSDMGHNMAGMADMVKVKYTDKGFTPEKVEVPVGSMVEFINESNTEMWVASSEHPAHTDLPTFDQFKPTKKGTVYRYVFDTKGTWKYHDHINASFGGVVTVN
jgi:plastocyanin